MSALRTGEPLCANRPLRRRQFRGSARRRTNRGAGYCYVVDPVWDVAIVGAGPAGAAAALGARQLNPAVTVLLLDKADFPRDKTCGDGIAPHVLDVLAAVGVPHLLNDHSPVWRMCFRAGSRAVARPMARPTWVVPRVEFDARLVRHAVASGAALIRHRVRQIRSQPGAVVIDDRFRARVVIGADGAHSLTRQAVGLARPQRWALAIRGYAPPAEEYKEAQVISFGCGRQPRYAWSFDTGTGVANIGYGALLRGAGQNLSRADMLGQLERLLPDVPTGATRWRAHHLPLSNWSWSPPGGRILLAGDAAGLVNPLSGEGIYHAVASGVLAGRCAAEAVHDRSTSRAGERHRFHMRRAMARNLRHTTVSAALASRQTLMSAALRCATNDRAIFDDLVELGLGDGALHARDITALLRATPRALRETLSALRPAR